MRVPWSALLIVALVAGCVESPNDVSEPEPETTPGTQQVVRFLAIGDQGTGDEAQHRVAQAMLKVCQERGCDFVTTNGDNIYETGVTSEWDVQFDLKFEGPYAGLDVPFYLSLGNHDNGLLGDTTALGDFQVRYHYRDGRASERWQMPDRFYQHDQGHVSFFVLDTNILDMDGDPLNPLTPRGSEQQEWLRTAIAESDATWKIAYGHHPYISNGQHGDGARSFQERMETTLCGAVDFLIAGHEHDLQWLRPVESCGPTEFLISGAAGKTRPLRDDGGHDAYFGVGDTHGFAWIEIVDDRFTAVFYDDDATVLYERSVTKDELAEPHWGDPL